MVLTLLTVLKNNNFSSRVLKTKFAKPWKTRVYSIGYCFLSVLEMYFSFIHGNNTAFSNRTQTKRDVSTLVGFWSTFSHPRIHFAEFLPNWTETIWCTRSYEIFNFSDMCFNPILHYDKIISWIASIFTKVETETGPSVLSSTSLENLSLSKNAVHVFTVAHEAHLSLRILSITS